MDASEKKDVPEKALLAPDHPLLAKFQQALKEHLLFQINLLKDEIFDCELEIKQKNQERETLGVRTYEAQQLVCGQQKTLEAVVDDLQTMTAAKEEMDVQLENDRREMKELQDKLHLTEKSNRELQHEIEGVRMLVKQMSNWEKKVEAQINVNKTIAEKTRKDMLREQDEKRQQDMFIYKLSNEIWRLEDEIETMALQIRVKQQEISDMEQTVAVGNANIEAMQAEYRCLMHSWNSVIVAIGTRDKGLECLNAELSKMKENLKSLESETNQTRKLTKSEQQRNESLVMLKARFELDIKNCKSQLDDETAKKEKLEAAIYEMQTIIEQTERDIESVKDELHHKEVAISRISKDYDKIITIKRQIEEKILEGLGTRVENDKAAKVLLKKLRQAKEKRSVAEVIMIEVENKYSFIRTETETQTYTNNEQTRMLKEVKEQQAELTKEADGLQAEINKYQLLFRKREREADTLNSKIEKMFGKEKEEEKTSPQELVIDELERLIEETELEVKRLQIYWLREQRNLLNVSNERQEQIHNINLMKKKLLILEQKNIKINYDIEAYKKQEEKVQRNITNLHNKATILCDSLCKKRNQKMLLDKNNILLQNHIETKLKDAEMAVLQIEADIAEIEEDKVTLSKELLEINREALEWDKQLQMAREAASSVRSERSHGGETANMRQEIHKMEVIYSNMRRAQDRLIKDLEQCVYRRDSIYLTSTARTKRANDDKTRVTCLRKLDNMRNKMKQLEDEIESTKIKIEGLGVAKKKILEEIEAVESDTQRLKEYTVDLGYRFEEAKTNRQFSFELLVAQQKKVNIYENVAKGRTPYTIYRKEDQLVSEYNRHKDFNNRLGAVVENLMQDFPDRMHELNRVNNTLKIGALAMVNL